MFHIHGGEYSRGASNTFPGHIMATFYKVIVVTFNYRLGALGKFITMKTSVLSYPIYTGVGIVI